MRASAASRISSLAHLHSAQANKDASKAEAAEASPFAIMVQSAAPKNDAKPSVKDEQQPQDEKNAAAGAADKSARETAKKDMAEAKIAKSDQSTKSDKADKAAQDAGDTKPSEDKPVLEAADVPADPALLAVDMPQPEIPPAPPPQLAAAAPDDTDEDELTAVPAAAVPAAAAPQAAADAPVLPVDAPPAPPAAAPQVAEAETAPVPAQPQPQTTDTSGPDAAGPQVAAPAAPQPQPATSQASPPQPAEIQTAAAVAPKPATATDTEAAKPGARKVQPQTGKDAGRDKNDDAQPSLARRDTQAFDIAFAAAPKAQPQAQISPDTGMAVHGLPTAAAQTASTPAPLPQLLQQAQVTAEPPKPNMPSLAVEIAARTQSGARQFDIRLDPPELGRVEVRLSIDATGKASAHLSADQPQTLELLQKDAPMLARALRDAGLDVAQDGLNFSLRQQAQNQGQNGGAPRGLGLGRRLNAVAAIETAPAAISYRANGRLDIRV